MQLILNGIAMGAIYALVAIGFVMVLRATNILNLTQGDMAMVGAFSGLFFLQALHLNYFLAFILAIAFTAIVGLVFERLVIRPIKRPTLMFLVTATIAGSILIKNVGLLVGGSEPLPFPPLFSQKAIYISGISIAPHNLVVLGVTIIIMILLQLFFYTSKWGIGMRAVMMQRDVASLMGINVSKSVALTFAISAALGAAGGILLAPLYFVSYDMGSITLKAFTAAALGGMYSLPGAIIGGLLIGLLENLITGYVTSYYRDAIVFGILILVFVVKPDGIISD